MHVRHIRALRGDDGTGSSSPDASSARSGSSGRPGSASSTPKRGSRRPRSSGAGLGAGAGAGGRNGRRRRPPAAPSTRVKASDAVTQPNGLPISPKRRWTAAELEETLKELVFKSNTKATAAKRDLDHSVDALQGFLRAADRELERHFTRKGGLYKSLEVVKQLEIGMRVWTEHDTAAEELLRSQQEYIDQLRDRRHKPTLESTQLQHTVDQLRRDNARLKQQVTSLTHQRNVDHDKMMHAFKSVSTATLKLESRTRKALADQGSRITRMVRMLEHYRVQAASRSKGSSLGGRGGGSASARSRSGTPKPERSLRQQVKALEKALESKEALLKQRDDTIDELRELQQKQVMALQQKVLSISRALQTLSQMQADEDGQS